MCVCGKYLQFRYLKWPLKSGQFNSSFLDYILHLFGRELMLFFGATRYHSCSDYWGDCRLIQMTWMHMDDFVLPTPCVFVCLQSS